MPSLLKNGGCFTNIAGCPTFVLRLLLLVSCRSHFRSCCFARDCVVWAPGQGLCSASVYSQWLDVQSSDSHERCLHEWSFFTMSSDALTSHSPPSSCPPHLSFSLSLISLPYSLSASYFLASECPCILLPFPCPRLLLTFLLTCYWHPLIFFISWSTAPSQCPPLWLFSL